MLNAEATLARTLDSIKLQGLPPKEYEVLAIDNGSRDQSAALATASGATLLRVLRPGAAPARNLGIQAAQGEILVFLDADTMLGPGWIEAVDGKFASPWVDCVQTPIRPTGAEDSWMLFFRRAFVSRKTNDEFHYFNHALVGLPTFNTAALAVRRRSLRNGRVAFCESFLRCEDTDFSHQLLFVGAHAVMTSAAEARVLDTRNPLQYLWRSFLTGLYTALVARAWGARVRVPLVFSGSKVGDALLESFLALNFLAQRIGGLFGAVAGHPLPRRQGMSCKYLGNLVLGQACGSRRLALSPSVRIIDAEARLILLDLAENNRAVLTGAEREDFLRFMKGESTLGSVIEELCARRFILIDGVGEVVEI